MHPEFNRDSSICVEVHDMMYIENFKYICTENTFMV